MALKTWILHRMSGVHRIAGRPDLVRGPANDPREPTLGPGAGRRDAPSAVHLGEYAPLVDAVRAELEHFVTTQLRLHLAIAERDRYLLTSIDVDADDAGEGSALLARFRREFTPEQIKRFLARDVVAQLPNASALDLSQFGGLDAARPDASAATDDVYAELVAQLRASSPDETPPMFDVSIVGRWIEGDSGKGEASAAPVPKTPLAGTDVDVEIDDADGRRHVRLAAVVPNRRYAIGKGASCDIVVNGTYASRRHCEVWLDRGAWWAADASSTNGIRVESGERVIGRAGGSANAASSAAIELVPGSALVLSASSRGKASEYPRVVLRVEASAVTPPTPLAASQPVPATPATPIAASRTAPTSLRVNAATAAGARIVPLPAGGRAFTVGRSRQEDLVVDWKHEGVSGQHITIRADEADSVEVVVHGDNGVTVGEARHAQGARFRWRVGERMTLGRASGDEPEYELTLVCDR